MLEPLKTHELIDGGYQATRQLLEQHHDLALIDGTITVMIRHQIADMAQYLA